MKNLTARLAELETVGIHLDLKDEYTRRETELLLGQSAAWVHRQLTGVEKKDGSKSPTLKGVKRDLGNGVLAWSISAEEIDRKLGEIAAKRQEEAYRRSHPVMRANHSRKFPSKAELAELGLTEEQIQRIRKLTK